MRDSKGLRKVLDAMAVAHQTITPVDLGPEFTPRVMDAVRLETARTDRTTRGGLWDGLLEWFSARFVFSLGGAALAAATGAVFLIRGMEENLLRSVLHGTTTAHYLSLGWY